MMVKLADKDVLTREVLTWQGTHLFHFWASSCSQKTRIVLNLKGIEWNSHPIDLRTGANYEPWYLGVNPRGLVPTLVLDGEVHIESNDIITELDGSFPTLPLIPEGCEAEVEELLRQEDELHLDLRTLTFRFMRPYTGPFRSVESLAKYRTGGSGTVEGKPDPNKLREIAFWEGAADGISDPAARKSALKFREALGDLEERLEHNTYLLGEHITVLDVAWFVYTNRLSTVGYPVRRLHPGLYRWFVGLMNREEFSKEIQIPSRERKALEEYQRELRRQNSTMSDIAGL